MFDIIINIYYYWSSLQEMVMISPKKKKKFTKIVSARKQLKNKLIKCEVCWKYIETETVSIKTGMSSEWNVNFLQNSPLCIQHLFQWVLHWSKHFWNSSIDMVWNCGIVFILMFFISSSNLKIEMEMLGKKKKLHEVWLGENGMCYTCKLQDFVKEKYLNWFLFFFFFFFFLLI